jgi:hypothetical protein
MTERLGLTHAADLSNPKAERLRLTRGSLAYRRDPRLVMIIGR